MVTSRLERIISCLMPVGLALYFCSLIIHPVFDDVWGHIKVGEWIVQHRQVPHHNLFMWPAWEYQWMDHEWLSQILLYGIYHLLGISGLLLSVIVVVGLAFFLLWKLWMRLNGSLYLGAICFLVAITACRTRLVARPEIFTLLAFALLLDLLYRYKYLGQARLWLIPPLFLVWANLHGGVFMGLFLLALFIMAEALSALGRWRLGIAPQQKTHLWRGWLPLALMGIAAAAACLVNPYGLDYFTSVIQAREGTFALSAGIVEWRPLFDQVEPCPELARAFWLVVAVMVPALAWRPRRLSFTNLLLSATFVFLAINSRRHIGLLGLVSLPVWATALADLPVPQHGRRSIAPWVRVIRRPAQVFALGFILAMAATSIISTRQLCHRVQGWVTRDLLPVGASNFLEQVPIGGHMFNEYAFGGYLSWRLYPKRDVFIHWIMGTFDERLFYPYLEVVKGLRDAASTFEQWKINYVVLPQLHPGGRVPDHLYRYLNQSSDWALVYWDGASVIYLRNSPSNAELLSRYAYHYINPTGMPRIAPGASPEVVAQEIDRALQANPPTVLLYFIAGDMWYSLGEWEEALSAYGKALFLVQHDAEIELKMGQCFEQKGEFAQALPYFKSAVQQASRWPIARIRLAAAYQAVGDLPAAVREWETAHRLCPRDPKIANDLGAAYYLAGRYQPALDSFQKVLALQPDFAEGHVNLGNVYLRVGKSSQARVPFERALQLQPGLGSALYGMACAESRSGRLDSSSKYLKRAIAADSKWRRVAVTDPDLSAVRAHPGFAQIMKR